mmetsp:Transcript_10498/g.15347  ORF Transcript_10498/g.15347 Transcript_10498/m.15347 type:complete len:434 (-) Transcript_10498:32-1333(-)
MRYNRQLIRQVTRMPLKRYGGEGVQPIVAKNHQKLHLQLNKTELRAYQIQKYDEDVPEYTLIVEEGFSFKSALGGLVLGLIVGALIIKTFPEILEPQSKIDDDNIMKEGDMNTNDMRDRFSKFADTTNAKGEQAMTIPAFIQSLIKPRAEEPDWVAQPRAKDGSLLVDEALKESNLAKMLLLADQDGDGLICFEEFTFFMTLLSSNHRQFEIAFKVLDVNHSNTLSFDEFQHLIKYTSRSTSNLLKGDNKQMKEFFGEALDKEISFKEFETYIRKLKDEILRAEFMQHDPDQTNSITVESFSELMTDSVHFNSLRVPFFKRQLNLLKTKGYFRPSGRVDFDTYAAFHAISENIDDIATAIQIHTAGGNTLGPKQFKHALTSACSLHIPNKTIDLVYSIFDVDNNGSLDFDEFFKVMAHTKPKVSEKGDENESF